MEVYGGDICLYCEQPIDKCKCQFLNIYEDKKIKEDPLELALKKTERIKNQLVGKVEELLLLIKELK